MKETQESISAWAVATFGDAGCNVRVAVRALEEMVELIELLTHPDDENLCTAIKDLKELTKDRLVPLSRQAQDVADPRAREEVADVVIPLYRLAERIGFKLDAGVDIKMEVNRRRKWNVGADGHGYHVKGGRLMARQPFNRRMR